MTSNRRSLAGVIASMAVVNLVYGITFPLLALVLDGQGISKTLIGLSTITQAAAIFAVAPFAPGLLQRFAPARIMQVSAGVLALLFVLAGWYPNVYFWFPLRLVIGAFTAMLWIASEALINHLAKEQFRGRIIGIYTSVGAAGFALGPLLLIVTGSDGMLPFYSTSALVLTAAVPLLLVTSTGGRDGESQPHGIWRVFLMAPVIMLINVAYASVAESMITFFPLYGMHLGLSEGAALGLMTLMGFGGMVLVLPLGWLADHVHRMGLLVACLVTTMACLLLMPLLVLMPPWLAAIYAFTFGGIEGMIYAVGVILIGERFRDGLLAAATTAYTACWGAGTIIGPLVVGIGMDGLGAGAMVWLLLGLYALYLPLPLREWMKNKGRPGGSAE